MLTIESVASGTQPLDLVLPVWRHPGPEAVGIAAAAFASAMPLIPSRRREHDGRRFRIIVSPGNVRVCSDDDARKELTKRRNDDFAASDAGAHLRHLEVELADRDDVPLRGVVSEWSRKSRANMVRTFGDLDYSPLIALGRAPAMVTLTYPNDWTAVAADGRVVKEHLRRLQLRFKRAWGESLIGLWKLEFQDRGAPHFHLWICPPHGLARVGEPLPFRKWLARVWVDLVDVDRVLTAVGRRDMLAVHNRFQVVDFAEGGRYVDPRRLAIYFSKHGGAGGGKEYQHRVPVEWSEPGHGPGRFWGHWGLPAALAAAELDVGSYFRLRRSLRRWSASKKLNRRVRVERVDRVSGVIRSRSVQRRHAYMGHGGSAGGFVSVNDGPGLALKLSALVDLLPVCPGRRDRGCWRVRCGLPCGCQSPLSGTLVSSQVIAVSMAPGRHGRRPAPPVVSVAVGVQESIF